MADQQEIIKQLMERLALLSRKQESFKYEIFDLKNQLDQLQASLKNENTFDAAPVQKPIAPEQPKTEETSNRQWVDQSLQQRTTNPQFQQEQHQQQRAAYQHQAPKPKKLSPLRKSNLEKFIGENLLNKIGILILVIGIGIGAKYSIENELISPLTRIILGYVSAIGLLGFGIKLKKKYEAYSAVLVSGAIVTLYFITFFAYSFYDLIPQTVAFILMVLFTCFTVVASLNYNRQIIAHLGLVGAYAVPFLLSNDSGRVEVLFSYIAIINIGILIIAFKKYWKPLYYSAFGMTWLIYFSWFIMDYSDEKHFSLALGFLFVFYIIFYLTFLAYKLVKKEAFNMVDIILLFANSFIFYGIGYAILNGNDTGEHLLGLFTLVNALLHFTVAVVIYKQSLSDKKLFYYATALVLTFITIAVPVQLDGNWVTLMWTALAVLLFWFGTTKNISIYEKLSYPLMLLAFLSMVHDWIENYSSYFITADNQLLPLWNMSFLTSMLFVAGFGIILYLQRRDGFESAFKNDNIWFQISSYAVPILFIGSLYYAFRLEIELYWDQLFFNSNLNLSSSTTYLGSGDYSLHDFKSIWLINYTLFFVGLLSYLNFKKIKNVIIENATLVLTLATIFVFLVQGLYSMSELRESYLEPSEYYNSGIFYLLIRYVSFVFLAFAMIALYRFIKKPGISRGFKIAYDIILHVTIVWVVSSELIHWLDIGGARDSYKLGLSILWGVYSFLLIGFGIWKNKPYLRIGGMILFGITLIKLFFYDLTSLPTISKTIVFVSLGILLLIISFLYNKYKNKINYITEEKELPTQQNLDQPSREEKQSYTDEFDARNDS
ncbi:MAG: DUF2339 domain-containing protein [Nonlabens sp.]|uniref:DUF2339 domain-containing protein n=1 Tax=Nonlabens sp. TaxID=1888209 RepID=UPI003EF1875C